jgi:hypothetical protein
MIPQNLVSHTADTYKYKTFFKITVYIENRVIIYLPWAQY